jgi:hypothetical protein
MAFTLERFIAIRKYLYHFTAAENLSAIRTERKLDSAAILTGRHGIVCPPTKRAVPMLNSSATAEFWLQTQAPLRVGNISFDQGWDIERFVNRLNGLVFFWPGDGDGPIAYGQRHAAGNDWPTKATAIRVETRALIDAHPRNSPLFCPYNSGAPRYSDGKASPRGRSTFLPAEAFERTAGKVKEVVFEGTVLLPICTQYFEVESEKWLLLDH